MLVKKMNYEQSVKRLREICDKLRDESTSLEETSKLYKEGKALLAECRSMLEGFSKEISEVSGDERD